MKKLGLLFILTVSQLALAQTNLIKNGGFEYEFQDWRADGVGAISPYIKKSGNNACTINQFVGADWKAIDQTVNIPKKTVAIEISGWVKTSDIEQGKNPWNAGKFDVDFTNSGDKSIKVESIAMLTGTSPWTLYKKTLTVPAGASKMRILLALGQTNGTIYFDDLKAIAITQEQIEKKQAEEVAKATAQTLASQAPTVLLNGNFEQPGLGWRGNTPTSTTVVKEGKTALALTSSTMDWTGIDQIADVPANATTVTYSAWLKSDSIKQGKEMWNNGLFNVEFTGEADKKTGEVNVAFVTATTDWTFYTKTFDLPPGTKKYRIMLALGFASGTLYADDINVVFK